MKEIKTILKKVLFNLNTMFDTKIDKVNSPLIIAVCILFILFFTSLPIFILTVAGAAFARYSYFKGYLNE